MTTGEILAANERDVRPRCSLFKFHTVFSEEKPVAVLEHGNGESWRSSSCATPQVHTYSLEVFFFFFFKAT